MGESVRIRLRVGAQSVCKGRTRTVVVAGPRVLLLGHGAPRISSKDIGVAVRTCTGVSRCFGLAIEDAGRTSS